MYVMRAVAIPMMVDPRPKDKAIMSLVETMADVNYKTIEGENKVELAHCSNTLG